MTPDVFSKCINDCIWVAVDYVGDNPLGPPAQGPMVELRQTQGVVQDSATRCRWGELYAAIIPDTASAQPEVEPTPPPRAHREEFIIGHTVSFTHKAPMRARRNRRQAECQSSLIAVNDTDGDWRVSYALLRKDRRHLAVRNCRNGFH